MLELYKVYFVILIKGEWYLMSEGNNSSKAGKVKGLFTEIKTHWKTPAEGKYVPYREYKDIF